MSNRELAPYVEAIKKSKDKFVGISNQKHYDIECIFAMQMLEKNDFSLGIATKNPKSVQLAMINVASTGLTLNPAHAYAYLVPRDGQILLDISYKGLIKIATDTGAINWVRADIVYANDEFIYNGPAVMPEHKADPFGDRGDIKGAYCIAKTNDGDILTEVMDWAEIQKIRDKSTAYTKGKEGRRGPWEEWLEQMIKKAIIKRASKTWPYTQSMERLREAIEIANESEGGYDMSITPTSGLWDELDDEEKEFLQKIAVYMKSVMPDEDRKLELDEVREAVEYMYECKLTNDETAALWTRFNSRQRTAMTKVMNEMNKEKAA